GRSPRPGQEEGVGSLLKSLDNGSFMKTARERELKFAPARSKRPLKKAQPPLLLVAAQFRRSAIRVTYRAATTGSGPSVEYVRAAAEFTPTRSWPEAC